MGEKESPTKNATIVGWIYEKVHLLSQNVDVLIDRFSNWHQCEMGGGLTFEVFLKNRTLFDEMENSGLNLKQGYSSGFFF